MGVDRLAASRDFGRVGVTVGRFPISYSVTSLFAPNDFFAPFSATNVNRVFKPGVDAVRVKLGLGPLSAMEAAVVQSEFGTAPLAVFLEGRVSF